MSLWLIDRLDAVIAEELRRRPDADPIDRLDRGKAVREAVLGWIEAVEDSLSQESRPVDAPEAKPVAVRLRRPTGGDRQRKTGAA